MGLNNCCIQKGHAESNLEFEHKKQIAPSSLTQQSKSLVSRQMCQKLLSENARKNFQKQQPFSYKFSQVVKGEKMIDQYIQIQNPDGFYHGQWKENTFHGKGQFFFKDGAYYVGTFQDGKADGQGRYIFSNGSIYEGQIKDNYADSYGIYRNTTNQHQYEGNWSKDLPNGTGTQKFDHNVYKGNLVNGVKEGLGKFMCQAGIYQGSFVNGEFEGKGTFEYKDKRKYNGDWKRGEINGHGIFNWPDGSRYQGQFENGLKHGKGVFSFPNGKTFRGEWSHGQKNGIGSLVSHNQLIKGKWSHGQLIQIINN